MSPIDRSRSPRTSARSGIVPQARGGSVEVLREPVVGVLVESELLGMPGQADDDRLVHVVYLPSSSMSVGQGRPVRPELGEVLPSETGQAVVLARRSRRRLAPVVVEEALAPHPAQQRVERALAGREVGPAEALQDVRDIDLAGGHDVEDEEFEEAVAERAELCWIHVLPSYLVIRKVAGSEQCVKPSISELARPSPSRLIQRRRVW